MIVPKLPGLLILSNAKINFDTSTLRGLGILKIASSLFGVFNKLILSNSSSLMIFNLALN